MINPLPPGQWWHRGLQLVEGCTKVSPACDNCWSLTAANMRQHNPNPKTRGRYAGVVDNSGPRPQWTGQVNSQWDDIHKIGAARTPQVYTVWTDIFHPGVPDEFVHEVLTKMEKRLDHFWILCTKRTGRALKFFKQWPHRSGYFQGRLMIMATVESQAYEQRIVDLLQIPGVLHGVSHEPALGPVDWEPYCYPYKIKIREKPALYDTALGSKLNLIVSGGETGPHARPSHPDWFRQARDQANAAGVAFFHKHNSEFIHIRSFDSFQKWVQKARTWMQKGDTCLGLDGHICRTGKDMEAAKYPVAIMRRVGKKAAGRLLDGVEHNEVPW